MTKTTNVQTTIRNHADYIRAIHRIHELEYLGDMTGTLPAAEQAELLHLDLLTMSYEDALAEARDAQSEYVTGAR
jgi:hypothetical protein